MKTNPLAIVILICLGVIVAAWLPAQDNERVTPHPARWQHLALTHDREKDSSRRELSRRINQLGTDGWELVDVENVAKNGTTSKTVFYFKKAQ